MLSDSQIKNYNTDGLVKSSTFANKEVYERGVITLVKSLSSNSIATPKLFLLK